MSKTRMGNKFNFMYLLLSTEESDTWRVILKVPSAEKYQDRLVMSAMSTRED